MQNKKTATDPIRAAERKIQNAEPTLAEPAEYVFDVDRIKKTNRIHGGSFEYIIETGEVEVVMQGQDTKILRKI